MIKELKLPKAGVDATIAVLNPEHLEHVLALQAETRAALPEAQKMFVLPQTPEYFCNFLTRQKGLMIGVWAGDKLIAQMVLMGTLPLEEAIKQDAITRNDVSFHHAHAFESVVVAKSMAVHPVWRGHELSASMLDAALTLPLVRSADHVFAQISVDNVRSWDLFLRAGFGIVAAGVDPNDNKPRFIMQKPALGFALHYAPGQSDVDASTGFAAIMRLTEHEALIGRPAGGDAFKLAFHASTELAAVWSDAPAASSAA